MVWRVLLAAAPTAAAGALGRWPLPLDTRRNGGTVDGVILSDTTGSTETVLGGHQAAVCRGIEASLPGDHLPVISFDSRDRPLYSGLAGSEAALAAASSQVRGLATSGDRGTTLSGALGAAAPAADGLKEQTAKHPPGDADIGQG